MTWGGAKPEAPRPATQMKIIKFSVVADAGSTMAFLDLELPSGMILQDLRLMRGPSGPWVAMSSTKQLDRDGNPVLDPNGKPKWRNHIDFRDRATRDRFSAAVLDAIRREHPDIVGDET